MQQIIGREKEMAQLKRCVESNRSEFVIVYGRRRVGKTFLVDSFFGGAYDFSYVGGHRLTKAKQLRGFAKALKKVTGAKLQPQFASWEEAFDALEAYLESLPQEKRKVIFIDEMPWIDTPQSEFVEALEQFWNGWGARRSDIVFIASGSASSWMMDKLVDNPGGLHARITCSVYVRPFTLCETREYLLSRGIRWDNYQILCLYMTLGGIPFYLSLLDREQTLIGNIDRLFFERNGLLRNEFDELYQAIFSNARKYLEVVTALNQHKEGLTFAEISRTTGIDGQRLSILLRNLERCDFIIAYSQFGNNQKGTIYRLVDFYTLFYYKFVLNNYTKDEEWWLHNYNTHSVESWQGRTFELVCLMHLSQIKQALGIGGIATSASSWRYIPRKAEDSERGAQIDLVIDRADHHITLCEMKFCSGKYRLTESYAATLRDRQQLFADKTGTTKGLVTTFISTFGLANASGLSVIDNEVSSEELFR